MSDAFAALEGQLGSIRCPAASDAVYKDQCIYSFDTPQCDTGLYVCMHSFLGVGRDRVEAYSRRTGRRVFLHLRRIRQQVEKDHDGGGGQEPERKITRLAIGVEGGFSADADKCSYREENAVVILPDFLRIPLTTAPEQLPKLPEAVQLSVDKLLAADSASRRRELALATGTWDGEVRAVSRHADSLQQLENGVRVPPRGWQCLNCDKTDNLWMNLSDGAILCGRRYFDGSGGNNHALAYYKQTGYPLAVKLGTISSDGKADVFSYDEDDMVEDPLLEKHLAHFGIKVHCMQKTDKSMAELEIEINKKVGEWAVIQEEGQDLKPLFGAGYTGLKNMGNSCYMNSVMQVLFTMQDFVDRYLTTAEETFASLQPSQIVDSFDAQMSKLALGLLSGKYSQKPSEPKKSVAGQEGIEPVSFKNCIGQSHAEFAGKRQQDAQEFFLHLINLVERNSHSKPSRSNPTDAFKHKVEERLECSESGQVRYTERTEYSLPLPVPMEAATNMPEVVEYLQRRQDVGSDTAGPVVRPIIPYEACLEALMARRKIEQFFSTAIGKKTLAYQTVRLATFPDYLLVQLHKFTVGDDWQPRKLDVSIPMPDRVDLSAHRGGGLKPHETLLPEPPTTEAEAPVEARACLDEAVVSQLMEMGFPEDGCRRAVHSTQNSGVEPAMQWIMEHMTDPDFATPFVVPGTRPAASSASGGFRADSEAVALIVSMGFTSSQAERALKETNNSVERAADWIFSHQSELADEPSAPTAADKYRDGSAVYELAAFISHMGTSTEAGHYVCHIRRDGRWCIYNDEKVAESQKPPKDLGYLYLYRRCES